MDVSIHPAGQRSLVQFLSFLLFLLLFRLILVLSLDLPSTDETIV